MTSAKSPDFQNFSWKFLPQETSGYFRSWIDTRFNVTQATFTDMNCEQGYWIQLKNPKQHHQLWRHTELIHCHGTCLGGSKNLLSYVVHQWLICSKPSPPCNSPTTVFTLSVYHPVHKSSHLWHLTIYWPLGCSNTLNPSEASNREDLFWTKLVSLVTFFGVPIFPNRLRCGWGEKDSEVSWTRTDFHPGSRMKSEKLCGKLRFIEW